MLRVLEMSANIELRADVPPTVVDYLAPRRASPVSHLTSHTIGYRRRPPCRQSTQGCAGCHCVRLRCVLYTIILHPPLPPICFAFIEPAALLSLPQQCHLATTS